MEHPNDEANVSLNIVSDTTLQAAKDQKLSIQTNDASSLEPQL
jgi:hypothetical protein